VATYYAESSVLVKRHVVEVGTPWVQALTDPAAGHLFVTSRISMVEVISALNRCQRRYRPRFAFRSAIWYTPQVKWFGTSRRLESIVRLIFL
jgi:predicted nucleic acid-binding protein